MAEQGEGAEAHARERREVCGADKLMTTYVVQGVDEKEEAVGAIELVEGLLRLGERLGGQGLTALITVKRAVRAKLNDVDFALGEGRHELDAVLVLGAGLMIARPGMSLGVATTMLEPSLS